MRVGVGVKVCERECVSACVRACARERERGGREWNGAAQSHVDGMRDRNAAALGRFRTRERRERQGKARRGKEGPIY